jgi:quinol monooxygenase YgiN
MFVVLWEFEVKPGCEDRFEKVYAPGGEWDSLFRRDANHGGTHLYRNTSRPRVYLTVDYWRSQTAYEAFLQAQQTEYKRIDAECDGLTLNERRVGNYQEVASPLR